MNLRSVVPNSPAESRRRRLTVSLLVGALVLLAVVVSAASLALATTAGFPDVPASHPYHAAITDLASRGVIGGFPDGTFGPDKPVTRQQFAKMIVIAIGHPVSESDVCPFVDVQTSGPGSLYPDNYVAAAAALGITQGTNGHGIPGRPGYVRATKFSPGNNITRHQVTTMAVRTAQLLLEPGFLMAPAADWVGNAMWAASATHGTNAAIAEYNGLLSGLDLAKLDPSGSMSRGEVAQVLCNLGCVLSGVTPTTSATSATSTTSTTTTASSVGKTPDNLVPKGQTAQVGDWKVKVTGATLNATQIVLAHKPAPASPQAGSQYVLVSLSATNAGSTTGDFFWLPGQAYIGSKGDRFELARFPTMLWPHHICDVSPGATVSGDLLFEVPSNQASGGCLELGVWAESREFHSPTQYTRTIYLAKTYFAVK
ncbi:MAG: S-layer homology domain-containing protein [Thermoleophilia bacterium]|nr:S-layer homology domain-containing protein [Thermoleophilia bacterium]